MSYVAASVPVAYEVARALNAPLDVFLVRKLGLPGHPELAMGAIASGGVRVLNNDVVSWSKIPEAAIEQVARQEQAELERREHAYRDGIAISHRRPTKRSALSCTAHLIRSRGHDEHGSSGRNRVTRGTWFEPTTEGVGPLLEAIGHARLVLIGEATHGTHEFYRTRAELTKALLSRKASTSSRSKPTGLMRTA